jgi:hypothetical protein
MPAYDNRSYMTHVILLNFFNHTEKTDSYLQKQKKEKKSAFFHLLLLKVFLNASFVVNICFFRGHFFIRKSYNLENIKPYDKTKLEFNPTRKHENPILKISFPI